MDADKILDALGRIAQYAGYPGLIACAVVATVVLGLKGRKYKELNQKQSYYTYLLTMSGGLIAAVVILSPFHNFLVLMGTGLSGMIIVALIAAPVTSRQRRILEFTLFGNVIFVGLAGIVPKLTITRPETPEHSKVGRLELVECSIIDGKAGREFPVLDIKLRNTGDVAFLKSAKINVTEAWVFDVPARYSAVPTSWEYSAKLPITKSTQPVVVPVSQSVQPQEVDRFQIRLGIDPVYSLNAKAMIYILNVSLLYDGDSKELKTPLIAVAILPPMDVQGMAKGFENWDAAMENDISIIHQINKINPPIKSNLLDYFSDMVRKGFPFDLARIISPENEANDEYVSLFQPMLWAKREPPNSHPEVQFRIIDLLGKLTHISEDAVSVLNNLASSDDRPRIKNEAIRVAKANNVIVSPTGNKGSDQMGRP